MAVKTFQVAKCKRWKPQPPPPPDGGGGGGTPPPPPPGGEDEAVAPQPFDAPPPKGGTPQSGPSQSPYRVGGLVTLTNSGQKGEITAINPDGTFEVAVLSPEEVKRRKELALKAMGR